MTGCRPGRGQRRSVGSTRPPPPPCTRTTARGKPEASSPPLLPVETWRGVQTKLDRRSGWRLCEPADLATAVRVCVSVCSSVFLWTDHAAALLAAVQPGRSAAVERASALVQTLAAGPVVTAGTAEQVFVWVCAVTGSPPAVRLPVLHDRGHRGQEADRRMSGV